MSSENEGGGNGMFSVASVAGGSHAPAEVMRLAEKLGRANDCPVKVTSEAKGYHIYIPCPDCLHTHKKRELQDPKYAINASIYLGLGKYRKDRSGSPYLYETDETNDTGSSICMRTRQSKVPHRFRVRDLLQIGTVLERHPDLLKSKFRLLNSGASDDARKHWEEDPVTGVMCPPRPGTVIPLLELGDPFHPAIEYLRLRNFDVAKLQDQFRCGFCVEEYKHGENGIFYRQMPGGWRDTPQHRIVFYSMIDDVPMTWQARLIEKISDDGLMKMMLNPYKVPYEWDVVAVRPNQSSGWINVPPFDATKDGAVLFSPSKYRTAKYSTRDMMGWDAACRRADNDPDPRKWVVLCEGPLDAARVGPGGVALIGSSISPDNAMRVASRFQVVFTAFDTDKAGMLATEKVGKLLNSRDMPNRVTQLVRPLKVSGGKDIGDMTQAEFDAMFEAAKKDIDRQL